jgi:hypothetical protein
MCGSSTLGGTGLAENLKPDGQYFVRDSKPHPKFSMLTIHRPSSTMVTIASCHDWRVDH